MYVFILFVRSACSLSSRMKGGTEGKVVLKPTLVDHLSWLRYCLRCFANVNSSNFTTILKTRY